jgi:hypothetical protein
MCGIGTEKFNVRKTKIIQHWNLFKLILRVVGLELTHLQLGLSDLFGLQNL